MAIRGTLDPKKTARMAGGLYLLMMPLGVFGLLYVPSALIVPEDAVTTATNIRESDLLFRLSIVSSLILQIIGVLTVLFLYKLLKPVSREAAVFMVVFLLVAVPIAMLNELNRFAILLFLNAADTLGVFTVDQWQALIPLCLDLYEHGTGIAGLYWGLWLFPMGYLVYRSGFLPRILGILLIIGGSGYLLDSLIFFIMGHLEVTISQFTWFGELLLPLWLVIKGVNVEQWDRRAQEAG